MFCGCVLCILQINYLLLYFVSSGDIDAGNFQVPSGAWVRSDSCWGHSGPRDAIVRWRKDWKGNEMRYSSARLVGMCLVSSKGMLHWKVKFLQWLVWEELEVQSLPQETLSLPRFSTEVDGETYEKTRSTLQWLYSLDLQCYFAYHIRRFLLILEQKL